MKNIDNQIIDELLEELEKYESINSLRTVVTNWLECFILKKPKNTFTIAVYRVKNDFDSPPVFSIEGFSSKTVTNDFIKSCIKEHYMITFDKVDIKEINRYGVTDFSVTLYDKVNDKKISTLLSWSWIKSYNVGS